MDGFFFPFGVIEYPHLLFGSFLTMLNLLLAILSSALIAIIMRISTHRAKAGKTMLAANYLVCFLLAAVYGGFQNLFPNGPTVGMGAFNGLLYLGGFVMMQLSVKRSGVVLSSVFMKLGLLVPMVLSVCCFGEVPTAVQVVGFLLAVAAIILINYEKGGASATGVWGLLLLLLMSGGGDAMSKVFEELGDAAFSDSFLFCTFLAAFLLCVGLVVFTREKPDVKSVLFGLVIGIPNFFSAKFLLMALQEVPAVIAYPTFSVASLLAVTLAGVLFFKEKLRKTQWVALAIIACALVLLNI